MGCHTWVSHKPTTFDIVAVEKRAKELFKEEENKINLYRKFINETNDELLKSFHDIIKEYYNDLNHTNTSLNKEDFYKNVSTILNRDIKFSEFITYLVYLDIKTENLKESFLSHLDVLEKSIIFECFQTQAFDEITDIRYYDVIDMEKGIYTIETELHDPFRVYGYPEDIFYTREKLEDFLFDKEIKNLMCIWSVIDENWTQINKDENYDLFVQEIKICLDKIYEKYPDAVISFG